MILCDLRQALLSHSSNYQQNWEKGHNNILNLDRIIIIYRLSAGENHVQTGGLQFTDKKIFPP